MKKYIYKFSLVAFVLFFCTNIVQGQENFAKKDSTVVNRIRQERKYKKIIELQDFFTYPSDIDKKSDLRKNADVTLTFSSSDESIIKFDEYYYSKYSGLYFYYLIPSKSYGNAYLTIKISYKGKTVENRLYANVLPIQCNDDKNEVNIGDTLKKIDVLSNDNPRFSIDRSSFQIIKQAKYGTLKELSPKGNLSYESNSSTPNYTYDTVVYRVKDEANNYDTANVVFLIKKSSYATKVFDFLPAPGQFTNEGIGKSNSAEKLLNGNNGMISLGGFGGYVIFGFDQAIVDSDKNPYGVDFSINGNAFGAWGGGTWSEPGAVQVMMDENGNGLPDDTWYELAGSNYYLNSTQKNLTMTYYNPKYDKRKTIPYTTNKGFSGAMRTNQFHEHPYYPDPFDFERGIKDSVSYTGNMIINQLDKSNPGYIRVVKNCAFGYVDNHPNNSNLTVPRNPYFKDENGDVSDGFDLKWAVDKNGESVKLDSVHFVKIYNPSQEDGGWLGEVSTEVTGIAITTPVAGYTPKDYYLHYIGSSQIQMLKGTTLQYSGLLFKNGIPSKEGTSTWTSSNDAIASVDANGLVTAKENGTVTIKFKRKTGIPEDSIRLEVAELKRIFIQMVGNSQEGNDTVRLFVGEKEFITVEAEMKGSGSGQSGYGTHNRYPYETYTYVCEDENIGTIDNGVFTAKNIGVSKIIVASTNNPNLKDTIPVSVKAIPDVKSVNDTILLSYDKSILKSNELFVTGTESTVFLDSLKILGGSIIEQAEINKNNFTYKLKIKSYGYDSVKFYINSYNKSVKRTIVFKFLEPDNFSSPKQVLFVNGGQFGSSNSRLMSYIPSKDTTILIDKYIGGAQSVQDMLIDGAYAYVSADYYITRYDVSKQIVTDSIYTQDTSATMADGKGKDAAGLNHKMIIYKNLLLATRQNSSSAPQDGYNVRIYNKGDLSFVKKIPVSNQATDLEIVGDKAYVMINGGFAGKVSSMAIINLNTLTLEKEVDLGVNGLGVMQMVAKNNKIYGMRLKNSYGTKYSAGVLIFDTQTENYEFVSHENSLTHDSSPLAIEPMSNDSVLWVKKDLGYVTFNIKTKTFGSNVKMTVPSSFSNQQDNVGRGSAYDPDEKKYYIAYGNWTGSGKGKIYDKLQKQIGTFKGVEASPEVLKVVKALKMNEKPYVYKKPVKKTYKEKQAISFELNYQTFKDKEDGYERPKIYVKNPSQYDWIKYDDKNRRFTGKVEYLIDTTTFNIVIQAFDKQAAFATDTVKITITPLDKAPTVANPIADITADEDSEIPVIDLSQVFDDVDNENTAIVKEIASNSNEDLLSATIQGNSLKLTLKENQFGEAKIVVKATSNNLSVTDTFKVTINAVDDAPTVANPIADITADEDSEIPVIDLSQVFDDVDNENTAIVKEIASNSNEDLLSATIQGNSLKITLKENQFGEAKIVVKAISNNLSVTDTFKVTINAVDDAPTVANPIADITADEDSEIPVIDLSQVFDDVDNENTAIVKEIASNSNEDLLSATIQGNSLKITLKENQFGEAKIVVKAISNNLSVTDTFKVTINAVDDAPTVANPIDSLIFYKNAADTVLNLSEVFDDVDNDNVAISIEAKSKNEALVKAIVSNQNLTLSFGKDKIGETTILLTALSNGKKVESSFFVKVKQRVGISEQSLEVKIYPNPVNDYLKIEGLKGIEKLQIISLDGSVVKISDLQQNNVINMQSLAKGIYILNIYTTDNKMISKKIIKQ